MRRLLLTLRLTAGGAGRAPTLPLDAAATAVPRAKRRAAEPSPRG